MTIIETLTEDQQEDVFNAADLITIDLLKSLDYGEEIKLTDKMTLSHYCEDEIIVLNLTEEWEEVFQILFDTETEEIIFESL
jgi:hypothetical protein